MKASGMPVLADDSGLMVDALDGAPGVYSARYGHKSSDAERIAYLLENLKDVPAERRTAKFVCVITCLWPDGRMIAARGECPGQILFAPKGTGGFGYDPVFYLPESKKPKAGSATYGEQEYTLKLDMSENGKELSFTKTFPNLKALFRNTHVLVDITFTEKDEVKVQVVPYAEVILEPEFGLKPETKN